MQDYKFLVTGGAGFIGSNIVEYLLKNNAGKVRVLDNLSTGFEKNMESFIDNPRFEFIKGDVRDLETCNGACEGMDFVSHQAALGSVPRSIKDPVTSNEVNVSGFLNMLIAAKEQSVRKFVYAASSSTYGDSLGLPKREDIIGRPLSPYAVTKYVNELYAYVFGLNYGIKTIGLRYFNVFGPRQNPNGAYAAVIPLFIQSILENTSPYINGDGEQTRDFTYVQNAVQANVKAMLADENKGIVSDVYNIAVGERTSLNQMLEILNSIEGKNIPAIYRESRVGDIKDSLADISKAKKDIGYVPEIDFKKGLQLTYNWFKNNQAFIKS